MRLLRFSGRIGLLCTFLLAGCGGGGSSTVPRPAANSGRGSSALTLRPAYISPGTQSLAIVVEPAGGQPIGPFSVNVTQRSTSCQTVTINGVATLTCSFTFPPGALWIAAFPPAIDP